MPGWTFSGMMPEEDVEDIRRPVKVCTWFGAIFASILLLVDYDSLHQNFLSDSCTAQEFLLLLKRTAVSLKHCVNVQLVYE